MLEELDGISVLKIYVKS